MGDVIYGIDFGGTNLRIAKIDSVTGELLEAPFERNITDITTNEGLTKLVLEHVDPNSKVGISAAGNVDEENLVIKESPNSSIKGVITFGKDLADNGRDVVMTNDMRAAVQAEGKFGFGKIRGVNNILVATYSSGFNCAVTRRNGDKVENVTQAEFGHMPYGSKGLFCGCGELDHLETYVSGNGAATMARQFFDITHSTDVLRHTILRYALADYDERATSEGRPQLNPESPETHAAVLSALTAKHVYEALDVDPDREPQKSISQTQIKAIADSFGMMNSAFNPLDLIVVMGGLTKQEQLFHDAIRRYEQGGLQLPSLRKVHVETTELGKDIGVKGAAAYYLSKR